MTELYSTTQPKIVIAELTEYKADRGFGFAIDYSTRDERRIPAKIFFHRSACRKAGGTPKKPELTNVRTDPAFSQKPGPRQRMLMKVIQTARGPKAIAWCLLPERTGTSDLIEDGGVERFIGSIAHLSDVRQKHEFISATVEAATLEPGCLELHITNVWANGHQLTYPLIIDVWLHDATGDSASETEYVISMYLHDRSARAVFQLPKKQS
jgi:hypothetical protein